MMWIVDGIHGAGYRFVFVLLTSNYWEELRQRFHCAASTCGSPLLDCMRQSCATRVSEDTFAEDGPTELTKVFARFLCAKVRVILPFLFAALVAGWMTRVQGWERRG